MSIRGRVGRHTQAGGRQCQNWPEDQQTVIALLNRIPVGDGGAGGSLTGRIISGMSSDALYRAISKFEDKYFPGQRKGFVEPAGAMLVRMEALAGRTVSAPAPAAPAAPGCAVITLPSLDQMPDALQRVISLFRIGIPTRARCLDRAEVTQARAIYGESLAYDDIYVSDGVGASNRPFTVALNVNRRWIVALSMGASAFRVPNASPSTLIHELAHAWQSQHHDNPIQFMVNCLQSQVEAAAATVASKVNSNKWVRIGGGLGGGGMPPDFNLGEASAYAYIPGKFFHEYGGEQVAQQVEDTMSGGTAGAMVTRDRMKSIPARAVDPDNVKGLSTTKYEFENTPRVVWPAD